MIIAHRLSTVIDCDRIYLMNQGEIIDQGCLSELTSRHMDLQVALMDKITRVGVDLDNTIIDYERAFLKTAVDWGVIDDGFQGSRVQLRDFLIANDVESVWQKLQGYIYGRGIYNANLYLGVRQFLKESVGNGIELFVVSHKTEFGHFDESKTNLREAASSFLEKQGVFDYIKKENIFFEATREGKISKIKMLGLDCFIDDLKEVLSNKEFPKKVKKILFSTRSSEESLNADIDGFKCWQDISQYLVRMTT